MSPGTLLWNTRISHPCVFTYSRPFCNRQMIARWWFFTKILGKATVIAMTPFPCLHKSRSAAKFVLSTGLFSYPVRFLYFLFFSWSTKVCCAPSCPWKDAGRSKWSTKDIPLTKHRILLSIFSSWVVKAKHKLEFLCRERNCQLGKCIVCWRFWHIRNRQFWWLSLCRWECFQSWGLDELLLLHSWQWRLGQFV